MRRPLRRHLILVSTPLLPQVWRCWKVSAFGPVSINSAHVRSSICGYSGYGPELSFDAYGATVERLATIVEEGELLRVLDAACGFQPSIKRIASSFAGLSARADAIDVILEDASLAAKLLIGADGANSSVRAAAGISATTKSYDQAAVVANFGCARPHLNTAAQWFTDQGVVALLPDLASACHSCGRLRTSWLQSWRR